MQKNKKNTQKIKERLPIQLYFTDPSEIRKALIEYRLKNHALIGKSDHYVINHLLEQALKQANCIYNLLFSNNYIRTHTVT